MSNTMIFKKEYTSVMASIKYEKKESMWTASVTLRVLVENGGAPTVDDWEVDFLMDDKRMRHQGFEEVYDKLFGEGSYGEYVEELGLEAICMFNARKVKCDVSFR
jgi:hypothetical protein